MRVASWFRNLRVAVRFGLVLAFALVSIGAVAGLALVRLDSAATSAERVYSGGVHPLADLATLRDGLGQTELLMYRYGVSTHAEDHTTIEQQMHATDASVDSALDSYTAEAADPGAISTVRALVGKLRSVRDSQFVPASRRRDATAMDETSDTTATQILEPMRAALASEVKAQDARASALAHQVKANDDSSRTAVIVGFLLAAVLVALASFALIRSITGPLAQAVVVMEAMAAGRLTERVGVRSHDETGRLAVALDTAMDHLADTMRQIAGHAGGLTTAADELVTTSDSLTATASESAGSTDQLASLADQVSGGIQTLAAGAEQMTSSISEIARSASTASDVATEAVTITQRTSGIISRLGDSSVEVGNVVKLITSIAEQTNLLALNATIEAARAGAAGKGFAVVAEEVKQLAQETARATGDIAGRIDSIQSETAAAVQAIADITEIIGRINDSQSSITSAVEEQSATTSAFGQGISRSADDAQTIGTQINAVADHAATNQQYATQTRHAAAALQHVATDLRQLITAFTYQ
jgi:methyl-accepting chemotaxis protein